MKHQSLLLICLTIGILAQSTHASGVLQLKGKIVSFDDKEITIDSEYTTYRIDRKALPKQESDQITKTNVDAAINVPMTAIKSAKSRKK